VGGCVIDLFFFFLLCLPFLVVFRLFVFFFLRKWVGGFNFNGFFFLSLSPSLSVCISLSVSLSVCVCACSVRRKHEVACAEFFWF